MKKYLIRLFVQHVFPAVKDQIQDFVKEAVFTRVSFINDEGVRQHGKLLSYHLATNTDYNAKKKVSAENSPDQLVGIVEVEVGQEILHIFVPAPNLRIEK